jgi:hypothetical protein
MLALHFTTVALPNLGSEWDVANAKRIGISGSPDFIQLIAYDSFGAPRQFRNLSRCSTSGESVWIAELPTSSGDAYVDAAIEGTRVIAWSWSGYRVEMNIESGTIESSEFTR